MRFNSAIHLHLKLPSNNFFLNIYFLGRGFQIWIGGGGGEEYFLFHPKTSQILLKKKNELGRMEMKHFPY